MTAGIYTTGSERAISGALALAMHLLFLVLLIVGVAWQKREPRAVVVDLWSDLPPLPAPKPPPPPVAKPAPEPSLPRVEPKPAPKVEPKVEPKPVPKPDIALKEKEERERKAREKALAEKKKREQEALAEKKRREKALAEKKRREEQARVAALKAQRAKEAEARRVAREQQEALRKLAAAQAAERARLVDEYKRRISEKIKRFIVLPPNLAGNPEVEFAVTVLPGGEVLDVRTRRPSTVAAWDSAVERAIRRAQPLPLPPDPALMQEFRELDLVFRPKE